MAPNGARHKDADRRVTWPPTTIQAMSREGGSAAGAALPGGRLVSDAGVRRAIRQAVDGLAAAEAEVPPAPIADRPAAFSFAQLGQRASRLLRDRYLLHRGRRGAAQGRENVVLGDQPQRHLALPRLSDHAIAGRQTQAIDLADDSIAADPDFVGDLAAGQSRVKAAFQLRNARCRPRPFWYVHGPCPHHLPVTTLPSPHRPQRSTGDGAVAGPPAAGGKKELASRDGALPGRRGGLMLSAAIAALPKAYMIRFAKQQL